MIDMHRQAFREEAYEILTQLETALLELEADPGNAEIVGTVFRYMHTIKGSGAMFGFNDIASFTHEVETVFDLVRSGSLAVTKELINLTLRAGDQIRTLLDCSETGGETDQAEADDITSSFKKLIIQPVQSEIPKVGTEKAEQPVSGSSTAYFIRFKPFPELFMTGNNPIRLFKELATLGSVTLTAQTTAFPPIEEIKPELCLTSWDILLISTCNRDAINDVFMFVEDSCELSITILDDFEGPGEQPNLGEILLKRGDIAPEAFERFVAEKKKIGEQLVDAGLVPLNVIESALAEQQQLKQLHKERTSTEQQTSIRVPADRLDHLVNLVGEQVTIQARLSQFALLLKSPELTSIAEEVARLTADLRDSTLNIRMLPIGTTFNKFRRLVRDLSGELGKEIEMTTEGEETELDKTVIEKLNDPLVHMIRNCIDHAIELPDVRVAKGKQRQGTIHLSARHSGDSVYISISDDGAGLDKDAILAKGTERGLIPDHADLTEREIFALIFAPGFSTAKAITSVSGRGVGMDVVKRSIEDLHGSIDVRSEIGKGTTITVRIPLTLAIIESLLVRIGEDHFMFPLSLVDECKFLTRDDLERAHGRHMVSVRDRVIPYIRLRERFAASGAPPALEQLVITAIDGERVGFVVDAIVGQHQTVIKSLGSAYKHVEGVSGATILGDGSVALILDVSTLYHAAAIEEAAA